MLTIANVNQDIESILKQDKSEGAMAPPLGHIVAMPVYVGEYTAIHNDVACSSTCRKGMVLCLVITTLLFEENSLAAVCYILLVGHSR